MQAAQAPRYGFGGGPDWTRDRAGALGLTLAVYAVMLGILFIFGGSPLVRIEAEHALDTILVTPLKPPPPPIQQPSRQKVGAPKLHKLAPEPALVPELAVPAVIAPIIDLPKTEFALEGPASTASGPSQTGGAGSESGPGGTIVYKAEWQKLNSPAELNRNLPRNPPSGTGWGEILCRASTQFKVTDCQLWKESPKGSGYGQAVLSIADVFRVKPPIVNGKPQLGAWVVIHIGYYNSRPPLY